MERKPSSQPNLLFILYLSKSAVGVPAPAVVTLAHVLDGFTAKEMVMGEPVVFLKDEYGLELEEMSKNSPDNRIFKAVFKVAAV